MKKDMKNLLKVSMQKEKIATEERFATADLVLNSGKKPNTKTDKTDTKEAEPLFPKTYKMSQNTLDDIKKIQVRAAYLNTLLSNTDVLRMAISALAKVEDKEFSEIVALYNKD